MSEMIRFAKGLRLVWDDHTFDYIDPDDDKKDPDTKWSWDCVCDDLLFREVLNEEQIKELLRKLLMFGKLDLSEAYSGHRVVVSFIPTDN